jgi:hypothetical protein
VEDFHLAESLLTGKPRFRRLIVSPYRPVNLCLDLSALADADNSQRLLAAAILLGTAVLDMKSTQLTVTAMGTSAPVIPFSFAGVGGVGALRRMILSLAYARPSRLVTGGQLMRAVLAVPQAHVIVVTHYLDPSATQRLAFPWGATVVAVEPRDGGLINRFGSLGGLIGMAGADAVRDEFEIRYAAAAGAFRKQRIGHAVAQGDRELIEALVAAAGRNRRLQ